MTVFFQDIAESNWFQNFILGAIMLAAALIGMQTYHDGGESYDTILHVLNQIVLWVFTAEVIIKIGAQGNKPWRYFKDPWNVFDFTIVASSLLEPFFEQFLHVSTAFLPVLRLARLFRVFRVLKIVAALPGLRLLVETLLKSMSSIMYVGLFLAILFYMYGVMAVFIFGENDPVHFRTLPLAILSLFRIVTLEDWTDIMYINMYGCDQYGYRDNMELCTAPYPMPVGGALFFVSFVLIGTMIIMNLFIGVIMNSMDQVKEEKQMEEIARRHAADNISISDEVRLIHDRLKEISQRIDLISHRVDAEMIPKPKTYQED